MNATNSQCVSVKVRLKLQKQEKVVITSYIFFILYLLFFTLYSLVGASA